MKAAMRVVLPPGYMLALFAIMYLIFEGMIVLIEVRNGFVAPLKLRPGVVILYFAAMAQAEFRVVAFHPFYRLNYCRWLTTTPWTLSKPLPLGPIHLVWQDLVVLLAVGIVASFQIGMEPTQLLAVFLFIYLAMLTTTFAFTGQKAIGYVMAFGLGLAVRLWHTPALCATTTMLLYPVGYFGLRRSLGAFRTWTRERQELMSQKPSEPNLTRPHHILTWIGWPFDRLSPLPYRGVSLTHRNAVLLSVLAGWWFYALTSLFTDPGERRFAVVFISMPTILMICMVKWVSYINGFAAPISFWGRLCTFRWFIRGYDRILLAPIVAGACGIAALQALVLTWGVPLETAGPIALSLTLLIVTNTGPSLESWRLTGAHRMVPVQSAQSSVAKGAYVKVG